MNLDYLSARKLIFPAGDSLNLVLVGCGGTGSWLAPAVVRIARLIIEKFDKSVHVHFVDPDVVEAKNVFRQNFCQAEIGRNKADALAFRYSLAWGVEITAWAKHVSAVEIEGSYNSMYLLIGCVDRASARNEILRFTSRHVCWWLDCGNFSSAGQVILGSSLRRPEDPFQLPGFCSWLPLPSAQHPELVSDPPAPGEAGAFYASDLSCADLAMLDSQGMSINQRIAAEAADYLVRMLLTKDLNRFATYIDLASGSSRSRYITPENLEAYHD
ncbi:MAG: thiamine biosynthesis protein ThiF [Desulforudis sp.]|nr:MAG: thiamine biosynthesis protein ThiF [Desulforudis sp.]